MQIPHHQRERSPWGPAGPRASQHPSLQKGCSAQKGNISRKALASVRLLLAGSFAGRVLRLHNFSSLARNGISTTLRFSFVRYLRKIKIIPLVSHFLGILIQASPCVGHYFPGIPPASRRQLQAVSTAQDSEMRLSGWSGGTLASRLLLQI